jgi:ATP synthase protein I
MEDPNGKPASLSQQVGSKAERRLRARRARPSVWFGLGLFGIIGWSVAVPTVLGILLGVWMDKYAGDRISWTLTLMLLGVIFGCVTAWRWIQRERPDRDESGR